MKKIARALELHRETLHRLDDATLARPVAGNKPVQTIIVSNHSDCACTLTCDLCVP